MDSGHVCGGRFFRQSLASENCARDLALSRAQDHEFDCATKEASEISRKTAAANRAQEEAKARQLADEQARVAKLRNQLRDRVAQIAPEPINGVAIAICFPDLQRVTRRFAQEQSAEDIFAFVANTDQMFDATGIPLKFSLVLSFGGVRVDRSQTLGQQGLTRRTLLRVELDDED
jgi:hypothetical protein